MAMEDKASDVINNVCTILGAALLLKPIIDEAAKTLVPEMQKLTSGEMKEEIKQLPFMQEKKPDENQKEYKQEHNEQPKQPAWSDKSENNEQERREC